MFDSLTILIPRHLTHLSDVQFSLLRNPQNFTFPPNQHGHRLQDTVTPTLAARNESQAISANLISQEKRLVLLVILLMFATCCCFGTAYYLFTTSRWAFVSPPISVAPGLPLINTPPSSRYPH